MTKATGVRYLFWSLLEKEKYLYIRACWNRIYIVNLGKIGQVDSMF